MGNRITDAVEKQLNRLKAYKEANTPRSTRPAVKPGKVFDQGLINPNQYNALTANRFKDSALGLAGIVPGLGDYASGAQAADYWNRGEKGNALLAGLGALPLVPSLIGAGATLGGLGVMAKVADKIGTPMITGPGKSQAGAIVYHGSPHKFDKFDMSKIGTGEGAQAYGHGLYMAESPGVAQSYKTAGQPSFSITYKGMDVPQDHILARSISAHGGDVGAAEKWLAAQPDADGQIRNALDVLKNKGNLNVNEVTGNLYKVDIPDEAIPRMLDWDKPLSEQAPEVQNAVGGFLAKHADNANAETARLNELYPARLTHPVLGKLANKTRNPMDFKGQVAIEEMSKILGGQDAATAYLKELGVPGIRYLDGNSRDVGGTSNFVLFDDQLPRILETNGVPTGAQPWAKDAIGLNGKPIDPHGKVRDNAAMKPLTENQFYNQYAQHVDIRGRDGSASANRESISNTGFGKSMNVNAMPVSRGGMMMNAMDKKYAPQAGDTLYLVPKSAYKDGPNGLKISEGWKPQQHEIITITDPAKPLYEYYKEAMQSVK